MQTAQEAEPSTTAALSEEPKPAEAAAAAPAPKDPIAVGGAGLDLSNFDHMWRFASLVKSSGWGPKGSTTESNVVAIQFGAELGVGPMQAIQNICVINGRPSAWGDLPLGICMKSPHFDHSEFREWSTGTPYDDDYTAHCRVRRRGAEPATTSFSVADAKRAKLWGGEKTTDIWVKYAQRMLMYRARGYRLRDSFPDVLKGLYTGEELSDVEQLMAQLDLGRQSTPPAAESPDDLRKRMTDPDKAEPAKKPEPAAPPSEPPADETEDNPELLRKAIMDKWDKINKANHKRVLKNLGIIGITVVNTMTDTALLRSINEALVGEIPPDAGS